MTLAADRDLKAVTETHTEKHWGKPNFEHKKSVNSIVEIYNWCKTTLRNRRNKAGRKSNTERSDKARDTADIMAHEAYTNNILNLRKEQLLEGQNNNYCWFNFCATTKNKNQE